MGMTGMLISSNLGQALTVNSVLFVCAKIAKQSVLTEAGLRHALFLGVLLWTALSWQGYSLCFSFLIVGSLVTKLGRAEKEALGIAEKRGGARGPENLWGAAAVAAFCAACVLVLDMFFAVYPFYKIARSTLLVAYTAALATKTSDTTASEIGKAYGRTTYLVTSFELVPKGTEGAVSLEGTVAGTVASLLAAVYGVGIGFVQGWPDVLIVVFAAFIATTAESVIGATIQEDRKWSNEFVNFLNTAIGAAVAIIVRCVLLVF